MFFSVGAEFGFVWDTRVVRSDEEDRGYLCLQKGLFQWLDWSLWYVGLWFVAELRPSSKQIVASCA